MHTIRSTSQLSEEIYHPFCKEHRMPASEIIKVLLDRCRECRQKAGKTVSFTVSGLERSDYIEGKVAAFFWETFGVKVQRSGNAQGRHFSFTFKEEMRQPLPVPVMMERRTKPHFTRATREVARGQLAFAN